MKACTDEEFVKISKEHGSPIKISKILGVNERTVYAIRRRVENNLGVKLPTHSDGRVGVQMMVAHHEGRVDLIIQNGVVIIGSDAHYWPGFKTTAHRALVAMCRQMNPTAVIMNGDAFDGALLSRFPRPFFDENKPTVVQELEVVEERLNEIEDAANGSRRVWCLGNHDLRYEARLAALVPEYQGVQGFHLKDRFPTWTPAWSCMINNSCEIRHRYKGGIHATHNNVLWNQHTTITGHLHSLKVMPFTDGQGNVKYGVDTGTLSDINGPQFTDYMEGRITNWRSGFIVLTFKDGNLLMPEIVQKWDEDHVQFRGHLLHADTLQICNSNAEFHGEE